MWSKALGAMAAVALVAVASSGAVMAQADYPNRPIHFVAPYGPGGTVDPTTRIVAAAVSEILGQPAVVENRAGAAGSIGTQHVINSDPDGYTAMNQKAMLDLLLTGRRIDATEATRLGIVTRAVPAGSLSQHLDAVLADLLRGSAAAITRTKQFVRRCETLTYQQGIDAATDMAILGIGAPEMGQGLSTFLEGRRTERS